MQEPDWSDVEVQTLRAHWKTTLTCEEIGAMCGGRTKNAVIAQASRLKLGEKPRAYRGIKFFTPFAEEPLPEPVVFLTETVITALESIDQGMCHWPLTNPVTGLSGFCGAVASGRYCDAHAALAYLPRKAKRAA